MQGPLATHIHSARYTRRSYPSARRWHEDGNVLRTYGLIRRQRRFLSRQKLPGVEPRARRASFASCRVRDVSASCRVRGLRGVCSIYHLVCSTDGSTWTADAWLRHVRLLAVGPRLVAVPSSQVYPDVLPLYGLALERRTERRASIGRRSRDLQSSMDPGERALWCTLHRADERAAVARECVRAWEGCARCPPVSKYK